jgi:sugar transferase (PEP-CTERM/EpsH1 system associated)
VKILFVTPRFPFPPVKGDRLRALYFIRELSKHHSVHLLSFIESQAEKEHISLLKRYCSSVETVYLPKWRSTLQMMANVSLREPFQVAYYRSKAMDKLMRKALRENCYDLIHTNLIRMAPYLEHVNGTPVVMDHIDCLSLNMERRYKTERGHLKKNIIKKEWKAMKACELKYSTVPSIVTSEKDMAALNSYNYISVVSNGVDLEQFPYAYSESTEKDIDVLFVGNMGYYPNAQAVEFFLEKVHTVLGRHKKDLRICVVGPNPNKKILSYDGSNVHIKGFVDDVREYYHQAKVFIAPMQSGSGIQNKILEAMACGVPVVSSPLGNAAIRASNQEEIIISDSPDHYAEMIVSLINDKDRCREITLRARKFVEMNFSWEIKGKELDLFYDQVLSL